ncbi:hypothetical protein WJX81_007502 [Elliptochloris bilobata]|uniref:AMP-activated protein kinase glycogen-binding domain-containing protein n=1 Tax=Elliptochloris bilobata TaxID=381761 RepID=A0AAW1S292_9CHLO
MLLPAWGFPLAGTFPKTERCLVDAPFSSAPARRLHACCAERGSARSAAGRGAPSFDPGTLRPRLSLPQQVEQPTAWQQLEHFLLCRTNQRPAQLPLLRPERLRSGQRAAALLAQLAEATQAPPIPLGGPRRASWALEPSASSADPLGSRERRRQAAEGRRRGDGLGAAPSAGELPGAVAYVALPWLALAAGQLGAREREALASARGLTKLLDMDAPAAGVRGPLRVPASPTPVPPLARAAAALQRLALRLGVPGGQRASSNGCHSMVLAHVGPGGEAQLAALLAAWLLWFGGLRLADSLQAGEAVVGARPEPGAVEAATAALAARARERATRVRLIWRYPGQSVEAAGPLLGGWGCRVPLQFCTCDRCWAAEVQGLRPGMYQYKYIVDGVWVTDLAQPAECDALGNVNNVVVVPVPPPGAFLPLPGSELALARRTAAALAFSTKMGVGGHARA